MISFSSDGKGEGLTLIPLHLTCLFRILLLWITENSISNRSYRKQFQKITELLKLNPIVELY